MPSLLPAIKSYDPQPAIVQATPYMKHINHAVRTTIPQFSSSLRFLILQCLYPTPYEETKKETENNQKETRTTQIRPAQGVVIHYGLYDEQQFLPVRNPIASYFRKNQTLLIVHDKNENNVEEIRYFEKRNHINEDEEKALLLISQRSNTPPPIEKDDEGCYCCSLQ